MNLLFNNSVISNLFRNLQQQQHVNRYNSTLILLEGCRFDYVDGSFIIETLGKIDDRISNVRLYRNIQLRCVGEPCRKKM